MMSSSLRSAVWCIAMFIASTARSQNRSPRLGIDPIPDIIKAMTLEEKASLVVGTGLRFAGSGTAIGEADGRVPGAAGNTMNIPRLGIPGVVLSDGPAGIRMDPIRKGDSSRTYYATSFPVGTLLASSWDTALVKRVGIAFGNEIKAYGIDVILGPGMNIQRDPLNGRNFEYYSEDPLLTGYMASAMVNGIQSNGVGTSIKHFAANNQETSRNFVNAVISERALREIYLKGFEIAVRNAQPWTVMSSYNKINGVYTSERPDLLTQILRKEWGFKGIVMTDWYGGRNVVAQMKAGNDLIEPGSKNKSQTIIDAVNAGTLDISILDENVARILNFIVQTPSFKKYRYTDRPDLKAHAAVTREAAAESMVLLKNDDNALPLKKGAKLALFGNASYQTIIGGTGSGHVSTAYAVSIAEGLSAAGFRPVQNLKESYLNYIQKDKQLVRPKMAATLGSPRLAPELVTPPDVIERCAADADAAVFTIGRNAGEGADRKVENDFNLSDTEKTIIHDISAAFHAKGKKLIIVLNIGGVIETASWRNEADAILLAWQPGLEAGNSVKDVLSGDVNPSGKLAITFPVKYEDEPTAKNFPFTKTGKADEVVYEEGIYVGYRYFSSFGVAPAYAFGYGRSYTTFAYKNLKLNGAQSDGFVNASVTIVNTGKSAGKEAVQLYISAPSGHLNKPAEELKAFAKTGTLKPGGAQTITFRLKPRDLASFDTAQSAWVADAGAYEIKIAASSEDIRLRQHIQLTRDILVEQVSKAVAPQVNINELKK